jgi:hypothetical protein
MDETAERNNNPTHEEQEHARPKTEEPSEPEAHSRDCSAKCSHLHTLPSPSDEMHYFVCSHAF